MPRVRFSSRRKSYRRRPRVLATRPRMMSKSLAFKRLNQVSTRTMYFKTNGLIASTETGNKTSEFRWDLLYTISQFNDFNNIYDQYKILGYKVKMFPANVGTESTGNPNVGVLAFNRGDSLIYSDTRFDPTAVVPTAINQVINTASAKMLNSRRPISRSLWRPKGKPRWGSMKEIATSGDDWHSTITHIANNQTIIAPPVLPKAVWYYTIQFKVCFRGRIQD